MDFTLKKIDKSTTEDIAKKNYSIDKSGISKWLIDKNLMTLEEDLQNFLRIQYASHGITINEIKSITLQLKSLSATDTSPNRVLSSEIILTDKVVASDLIITDSISPPRL